MASGNPFLGHPEPYPAVQTWRAVGVACVDGDTYDVVIDQGFDPTMSVRRIRLDGADTWEVVGADRAKGLAAKAFAERSIVGKPLRIFTRKMRESDHLAHTFERYIARVDVWWEPGWPLPGEWYNFAEILNKTEHVKSAAVLP